MIKIDQSQPRLWVWAWFRARCGTGHGNRPPESFDSLSDRDVFFDRQIARIRTEAVEAITKVNDTCNTNGEPDRCKAAVDAIEDERLAKLDANEAMRQASVVR